MPTQRHRNGPRRSGVALARFRGPATPAVAARARGKALPATLGQPPARHASATASKHACGILPTPSTPESSMHRAPLLLALIVLLAACAAAPPRAGSSVPPPAAATPPPSALPRLQLHDRLAVGPQPSADDLRALRAQGYTRVISVRTAAEMDDRTQVPFDEAALAAELGMEYLHLPQGGEAHPFRPELVSGLAAALAGTDGKVLLHCASGARASLVYAAYAMTHLGIDPDTAMRTASGFGMWPLPLERMTGVKLKVVRADAETR
jgi:uncharacterized protein (TIGR01244 family)